MNEKTNSMSNQSSTLLHKMQCRTYSRSRLPACIKGIARAISLALIVSLSLSSAGFTPAIAGAYDADQLLIKNQFKQAEEQYRGQLDEDTTGDAYAGLAVALAKQGTPAKVTEAEKVLKQSRDKFPDNPNVIAAGGYVSFIHSKTVASPARRDLYLEAAETLSERAIKASPDILIAHQTLGLVKLATDDAEGAVEPFHRAVALAENAVNLTLLAQAEIRANPKELEEPQDLLKKALALKPDYPLARLQKALVLSLQNKPEDAFSELHNIPEAERNAEWYAAEGDIYRKQGDGPGALASWHEAMRRDPHNPEPYRHMAEYYSVRGDGELAINEMHNALEILPNDMNLRGQLAELALRQDKLDVAESEYRTILNTQPDDPNALLGLTRVGFRKARRDGTYPADWQHLLDQLQNSVTEQSVKGSVIQGTKNLQEHMQLQEGEKALSQNRFRDAHEHFTTVINDHRDDSYELLTLGDQFYNDGDFKASEQAFTYAKETPEIAPRAEQGISKIVSQRNEAARQTKLGDATLKLPDVAIDHYKQALIADPECPSAHYGLFQVNSRGADADQAIANASCFLESADDSDPRRREVESSLVKLKKRASPRASKGK